MHLLSFMDHTPGQGQYRNLEIYKLSYIADEGLSEAQVEEELRRRMHHETLTLDKIQAAADKAFEKGIAIASHDDDTIEKLDVVQDFHATISEFPITMEVCAEAHRRNMATVVGAPNILLAARMPAISRPVRPLKPELRISCARITIRPAFCMRSS